MILVLDLTFSNNMIDAIVSPGSVDEVRHACLS